MANSQEDARGKMSRNEGLILIAVVLLDLSVMFYIYGLKQSPQMCIVFLAVIGILLFLLSALYVFHMALFKWGTAFLYGASCSFVLAFIVAWKEDVNNSLFWLVLCVIAFWLGTKNANMPVRIEE